MTKTERRTRTTAMERTPQWVLWRAGQAINPYTGGPASAHDPLTWGTYREALAAQERYGGEPSFVCRDEDE